MREDITEDIAEEILKKEVFPIILVRLETSMGNVLVWTGYGKLIFNGETYLGAGDLGKIGPIRETADEIRANMVNLQLTGIPNEYISMALGAHYKGRSARIWLGFLSGQNLIPNPIKLHDGRMDIMEIDRGPETSTITVTSESRLADLNRARVRRYTDEDQKIHHPNDRFFEYVASIQNAEIVWRGT